MLGVKIFGTYISNFLSIRQNTRRQQTRSFVEHRDNGNGDTLAKYRFDDKSRFAKTEKHVEDIIYA